MHTLDKLLIPVIVESYIKPFTCKSDFARENAERVAAAACEGYITTRLFGDVYTGVWRVTEEGLTFLRGLDGINREEYNDQLD